MTFLIRRVSRKKIVFTWHLFYSKNFFRALYNFDMHTGLSLVNRSMKLIYTKPIMEQKNYNKHLEKEQEDKLSRIFQLLKTNATHEHLGTTYQIY